MCTLDICRVARLQSGAATTVDWFQDCFSTPSRFGRFDLRTALRASTACSVCVCVCERVTKVGVSVTGQAVAAWMVFVLRAARAHLVRHIAWRKGSLNDAIVDLLCSTTYPRCGLQRVRSPCAFSWCTQHGGSFVGALKCCLYEWMGVGATTRSY